MKRELFVFLAVCAFAVAMVPRSKRHIQYCAPTTPCGWSVYKLNAPEHEIITTIQNTYCVCETNTNCEIYEDDNAGSLLHRCKPIKEN